MSQVKVLPQSKEALLKSYNKRLKDDIKSMVDNFTEIVKLARPTHEDDVGNVLRPLATCQDQCEMHVRASNIVNTDLSKVGFSKVNWSVFCVFPLSTFMNEMTCLKCHADAFFQLNPVALTIGYLVSLKKVRAAESLMKLISDIKQYLILNDFPSVNDAISQKTKMCHALQDNIDSKLAALRDDMAAELYDLEEEYYSSVYKLKPMFSEENVLNE